MEGNGMSRAAKKRAMKRQKQQHSKTKQNDNATVEEEISTPLSDEATESKDVILKRRLPMEDAEHQGDNHVKPMKKKSTTEKKMKKKRKASVGDSDDEQETADASKSVSNQIERDVDKILAQLTPRQLLFPSDEVTELDQNEMAEGGLPDPKTLARDITAEKKARCVFNSILSSANKTADEFYNEYWEKKPIVISLDNETDKDVQERHRCRFDGFLSMKEIRKLLKTHALRYGQDLNVTRYEEQNDGVKRRITLDLLPPNIGSVEGGDTVEYVVADAKDVWSNFQSGCTVRLLCPQKHVDPVHSLLSTLELEFGCMIGANAYLTPGRNSQGFAPHYDDIEAFILQLEGYKHWRVYPPFNKLESLPRVSSRDYTDKEMEDVEPVLDVVLGPGDVLYMPRGWIHQAHTPSTSVANEKDGHSLHLTISAMQTWAWGDLLDMVMPEALEAAAASDTTTSLREGLPRNFLSYMGAVHDITSTDDILPNPLDQTNNTTHEDSESEDEEEALKNEKIRKLRESFKAEAKKRIMRVCKEVS
jgi:lysine-specific demethylase/histidyl-hydroxylase NO66